MWTSNKRAAIETRRRPIGWRSRLRVRQTPRGYPLIGVGVVAECVDEVGDLMVFLERVAEGVVGSDDVVVPASVFAAFDASDGFEVEQNLGGGAFGDVDALGDVLEAQIGSGGHGEEDVRMVGEERPGAFGRHVERLAEPWNQNTGTSFRRNRILLLWCRLVSRDDLVLAVTERAEGGR